MRQCLLFLLVAPLMTGIGSAPIVAEQAPAVKIEPHRAIYTLELAGSEFGSGIADASGTMAFEWGESCDAWIIQQKALFDVFGPEGAPVRNEVTFSSWESKAGDQMGFSLRTLQDGELIEDLRGQASLDREKGGGEAVYTRPGPRKVTLPPGTVLSAAHTIMLIRTALSGETSLIAPVFLGQRDDEPMTVNGIISASPVEAPAGQDRWEKLLDHPAWRMHLAFYGSGDSVSPAFEVHETLYANGVVGAATVLYDTFSFSYSLDRLELLPEPEC